MPKLQYSKKRYSITVAKDLIDLKGWKKGQRIVMVLNSKNDIVLKEVKK